MIEFENSSVAVQGAIREFRTLAIAALARALQEPVDHLPQFPHLAALLAPERQPRRAVLRRGARMNRAMLFTAFDPGSPLQHQVLASGVRMGFVERAIQRLQRRPAQVPPGWIDACLRTAFAASGFQARSQGLVYLGLRRRVFFAPGGPPSAPLSVATFAALIVWSGCPKGFPPEGWVRLEDIARRMAGQANWAGPTDRLVLAEARKTFGLSGPFEGKVRLGIGNV